MRPSGPTTDPAVEGLPAGQHRAGKDLHPSGTGHVEHDIDLRLGTQVTGIDCSPHEVSTSSGETLGYDKLLVATGSSPRRLTVPGADLAGVHYLRRVADSEALQAAFASAQRVAIIGAGWIGLETAVAARAAGCHVTLIERAKLPLLAVLGEEVAETCATLHRAHGVELRLDAGVAEIIGASDKATGVRTADGDLVAADAVVVGVGITPNTELAEAAGLHVDNGIVVDEHLSTSDPAVFAAGDVANSYYPLLGKHLRLEHWSAALNQGPVAAANMMGTVTPTTMFRTSSPTNTTSAWSTPATSGQTAMTGSSSAATSPAASSSPSGCATDECWPA